jgi:hypothetical protein
VSAGTSGSLCNYRARGGRDRGRNGDVNLTLWFSEGNRLMLFGGTVAVCCENRSEHKCTVWAEFTGVVVTACAMLRAGESRVRFPMSSDVTVHVSSQAPQALRSTSVLTKMSAVPGFFLGKNGSRWADRPNICGHFK